MPALKPEKKNNIAIRPYEPKDRSSIRNICWATANKGEPHKHFFMDRETFADWMTKFYTDYEPHSTWVAEFNGQVMGYLNGCLNPRRYRRVLIFDIGPRVILRTLTSRLFWHFETLKWFKSAIRTVLGRGWPPKINLDKYPAHLHINIRREFRGQGIGQALIQRFLEQVKASGLPGVHLATREDNENACRFFERMGFMAVSRHPVVIPEEHGYQKHNEMIYGKSFK